MFPKNFRTLKLSISEKFLGMKPQPKPTQALPPVSRAVSGPSGEDPYREILTRYDDNVSHLVLHGSSLRSMISR